jgi:hypothetical protein
MSAVLPTSSITPRRQSRISIACDLSLSDLSIFCGLSRNKLYGHMHEAVDPLPYFQYGERSKAMVNKEVFLAWRARRFASIKTDDPAIVPPRRRRRKSRP